MGGRRRRIWVIVLAGGAGQRLSALTTTAGISTPKQYCSLDGGPSLLRLSLRRALAVAPRERIVPVVNEAHRRWWEPELLSLHRSTVVVQPRSRGTGLGVLLPLLVIAKSDPEAGVVCIPSDHYVEHEEVLAESLRQATAPEVLDSDKLTLLGISPHAPDSGFGYLLPDPDSGTGMRPVRAFIEKPEQAVAGQLIRDGSVWSSGIVAGRIDQIIELYPREPRGLRSELQSIVEYWSDTRRPCEELATLYARCPTIDFSRDVLQKYSERLQFLTVPPCGWSDVGTPLRLATALWSKRSHKYQPGPVLGRRAFNLAAALTRHGQCEGRSGHDMSVNECRELQPGQRPGPWIAGTAGAAAGDEQ